MQSYRNLCNTEQYKYCEFFWSDLLTYSGLTAGFWGKEAWRPPPKWNTRFFFAFSMKEMGKFLWEGRKKGLPCWLSQFSFLNWNSQHGRPFSQPSQTNFHISFKAILENAKKNLVFHFGGGRYASFPQKPVFKCTGSLEMFLFFLY